MARYVFRGLNKDDLNRVNADGEKQAIVAKKPGDTDVTLREFIEGGTKRKLKSRFISLTDDPGIADIKYASLKYNDRIKRDSEIIIVDLDRLDQKLIHDAPAKECSESDRTDNSFGYKYSEADNEIIYENEIRPECYHVVHPLLTDILTGYSMQPVKSGDKIDQLCDLIFNGKTEEVITNLLKNAKLNDVEKFFVEKYYGLIIDENGNVSINKEKKQPLRGDAAGVEEEIKKHFQIEFDSNDMPKIGNRALLARCIQTGIIRKLDYEAAGISPLHEYTAPIREMAKAEYAKEGRYHKHIKRPLNPFNWLDGISENKRKSNEARTISSCLRYDPKKFTKYKTDKLLLPRGISYQILPEGKIRIQLSYQSLEKTSQNTIFELKTIEGGLHRGEDLIETATCVATIPKENVITAAEVVQESLQRKEPLTKKDVQIIGSADKKAKEEEKSQRIKTEEDPDKTKKDPSDSHDGK